MLSVKRFSTLLLCTVMLLSTAVGCKDATANGSTVTTTSEAVEIVTEGTTETEVTTETEATTETPEPESNYEWVVEPGNYGDDIRPIYGASSVTLELSTIDDKYLVDFNGNIIYTLPEKVGNQTSGYGFCYICDVIYCANGVIEPDTYEYVTHMGHGGDLIPQYIYDSETGDICYYAYGGYAEVDENIPYAIVTKGIRRPATPEDNVGNDYAYDLTNLYGIVINSELVVPFEYDEAVRYDAAGIAKLKKDGKWAFFNSKGKMILGNDYLNFFTASSGYIALNRDGKWGYADLEGNIVIDHVFEEARPVYCGKAWVKTDAGWGVIKIDEPEIMTEEEAKQAIRDEFSKNTNLITIDITPNGKNFYESVGYGFDVKATYTTGYEMSRSLFVNYDGTIFSPQYFND